VNLGRFSNAVYARKKLSLVLASLELARLREITVAQAAPFEDILIEPWAIRSCMRLIAAAMRRAAVGNFDPILCHYAFCAPASPVKSIFLIHIAHA
jgi:hypothetical protein